MCSNQGEVLNLPHGRSIHPGVWKEMSILPLWFNRELETPVIPEALQPFVEGTHYLSTKQVPSALLLRTAGSQSVIKNREVLLRAGFTLREESRDYREASRDLTLKRLTEGVPLPSGSLASMLIEAQETMDILSQDSMDIDEESEHSGSECSDASTILEEEKEERKIRFRKNVRYRIRYEDPWKIHAGSVLGRHLGKNPETVVWSGDGIRLQDPLPRRVLGPNWTGSQKNSVRFSEIAEHDVRHEVVYRHTHWGKYLSTLCNTPDPYGIRKWARTLRYRINRFLQGKADPLMSERQRKAVFVNPDAPRSRRARALRFVELLKTVDGVFLQRYLAYPEEVWTWERFDKFTLGNLALLLGDEFLDGDLTEYGSTIDTAYSQLKRSRKWFKANAHSGRLERALESSLPDENIWCRQFVNLWRRYTNSTGFRKDYLLGLLSQTRGCGTPPPVVVLQSKVKFLKTISTEAPPENPTYRMLRRAGLEEVLKELPDQSFTGLATKSRVTVTTAACWESNRRNGGTTEEIRRIISSISPFDQVPIRDLETGRVTTHRSRDRFDSVGELIFWSSLDLVLRTPPEDLRMAFLTVVKEPGKARSVTKARACLKVVLDLVNKLCSEPLAKGIRSSHSGMAAANHGWNFFLDLMSREMKQEVFSLLSREENPYEGYVERTDTFEDLYMSSTDYEEATDQELLYVASDLGNAWMRKCGIPRVLRGIVNETCYKPRTVYFHAKGVLATIGHPTPDPGVRFVHLRRGILMGDPLTKVVLHLTNVVARHVGKRLHEPSFYTRFGNSTAAYESFLEAVTK